MFYLSELSLIVLVLISLLLGRFLRLGERNDKV